MPAPRRRRESSSTHALVDAIRTDLRAAADPSRAPAMQAYMKSTMPFLGVGSPAVQAICRRRVTAHGLPDRATFVAIVQALWNEATHREERYAAILVTGHRLADAWQRLPLLPLYRHLAVSGAWWDLVDPIATQRLHVLLERDRAGMARTMRAWARHDDIWLRRCAILCQLKCGADTDVRLLQDCLEPSIDHRDFFVRKGMGWALRQFARTDPSWVRTFVDAHRARLSGLTVREATKHLQD